MMINPDTLKRQLAAIPTRYEAVRTAERWGKNQLDSLPTHLLPPINEAVSAAINRLAVTTSSIGPRIIRAIKFGTIGHINWGGDSTAADELMEALDIGSLADELLENGLYRGVMDGIVRRGLDGLIRIEPLIGHTEPLFAEDSPVEVIGYLHAWMAPSPATGGSDRWNVRLYEYATRSMWEGRGLRTPTQFMLDGAEPTAGRTAEYPAGAPMPRYTITDRGIDRLPRGYFQSLLPLVQGDWVSQLRGDRTEESTAFAQLLIRGEVESATDERSPTHILRVHEGGGAEFLQPGDLSQMHAHHDRKLDRLKEDASMPGGFTSAQTPSGEALREANAKFLSLCQFYARALSRVLTALAADYCEAQNIENPGNVVVSINRDLEKEAEATRIREFWRDGLISFGAAVRAVAVLVPTWESEDVEAWITAEEGALSPDLPTAGTLTEAG